MVGAFRSKESSVQNARRKYGVEYFRQLLLYSKEYRINLWGGKKKTKIKNRTGSIWHWPARKIR